MRLRPWSRQYPVSLALPYRQPIAGRAQGQARLCDSWPSLLGTVFVPHFLLVFSFHTRKGTSRQHLEMHGTSIFYLFSHVNQHRGVVWRAGAPKTSSVSPVPDSRWDPQPSVFSNDRIGLKLRPSAAATFRASQSLADSLRQFLDFMRNPEANSSDCAFTFEAHERIWTSVLLHLICAFFIKHWK